MEIWHKNETSKKVRLLVSREMQPTLELYAFLPLSVASSAGPYTTQTGTWALLMLLPKSGMFMNCDHERIGELFCHYHHNHSTEIPALNKTCLQDCLSDGKPADTAYYP